MGCGALPDGCSPVDAPGLGTDPRGTPAAALRNTADAAAVFQFSTAYAEALITLLRTAFHDARSLLVLYDGSTTAEDVMHRLLVAHVTMAVQVLDLTSLEHDEDEMEYTRRGYHNSDLDITIFLFVDAERVKSLLEEKSGLWWTVGPLLLFNLDQSTTAR